MADPLTRRSDTIMKLLISLVAFIAASSFVVADPIATLVEKLSKSLTWSNGGYPKLDNPKDASAEEVIAAYCKMSSFQDGSRIREFTVLEKRTVKISLADSYVAARCKTDHGPMIFLIRYIGKPGQWWIRRYDAPAVKADDTSLSQVAERLSRIAEQMKPVALVAENGRNVTLSYNTRTFMVHSSDKLGRRSDKAHEETGPRYDGLMVHITVGDGRYAGAARIPQNLRRPYWITFVNAYPIAKGKQHLHVNISFGNRTDRETIGKIKNMLTSMIDDDPKVKAKEPGGHNKTFNPTK